MDYDNKKYLKLIYVVFTLFLLAFSATGQNVKVILDGPTEIGIDDRFQLNVTVNAEPTEFNPPDLKDFNILSGPNESSGTNIEVVNGRMKQSVEFTYSYILQPKKAGKFNLGTAAYTVKGKKYVSNSLTIEVTGTSSQANQSTSQPEQKIDETDEIFLKVILDKTNVYQGEFITGTVKIFTKYDLRNLDPVSLPAFDGFYKQEIETPPARLKLEVINGQRYGTATVQKFVLIPQKSGELTVPPYKIICTLSGFFSERYEAKSRPVKVTVKPLPSRPASFTGAVGKFNLDVKYDKTKVRENEPVILKISVNGAGNIKLFDAPKISFPEGIDTSEPTVTNKTNDKDGGISGSKLFEYLLIPRAPGKITMPPVEFSYFDPVAKQYKTLTTSSTTLEVEPGSGDSKTTTGTAAKEDLRFLGKDIEYIKLNEMKLRKTGSRLYGSMLFYASYLIPLLLFIAILVLRRNYIKQNANTALTRNRKAQKYAIKRLKKAKEYLAQSKKENFYEEVLKALWGYLSDKLNIPVSELSRETARDQLLQASVDEESINRVMNLIETCEYARYAPASADNSMEADYREAIAIITQIQERIR